MLTLSGVEESSWRLHVSLASHGAEGCRSWEAARKGSYCNILLVYFGTLEGDR